MNERYIVTADLGTSKIDLTVARVSENAVEVVYHRETASAGISYSCVLNPKNAAESLKKAVKAAEEELDIKITGVVNAYPRFEIRQQIANAVLERSDENSCIAQDELDYLKSQALENYPIENPDSQVIFEAIPQSFSTEDMMSFPEEEVIGMTSSTITGIFRAFVGSKRSLSNLDLVLDQAGLASSRRYFLPTIMADSILTHEEKENGSALIEIGAGVSSVSIFHKGILCYYNSIPFGASNITTDIQHECGFRKELAENIKLAYGVCIPEKLQSLSDKILSVEAEDGTRKNLPVRYLSEIVTSRMKEIYDAMLFSIQESGYADKLRAGVILTGGCANLTNCVALLKDISGYNVRVGYPKLGNIVIGDYTAITETSAASTVAMIQAAAKDPHVGCVEFNEKEETVFTPAPAVEEEKPKTKSSGKVTVRRSSKENRIGSFIDRTFGTLFDEIED